MITATTKKRFGFENTEGVTEGSFRIFTASSSGLFVTTSPSLHSDPFSVIFGFDGRILGQLFKRNRISDDFPFFLIEMAPSLAMRQSALVARAIVRRKEESPLPAPTLEFEYL